MIINRKIAKLHFITSDHSEISHADQAIRAYKAGCKWVQLRMKEATIMQIEEEILKILPVANQYNAILLINDHVELVLKTGAHGVHLGKSDMCPAEARSILGENYIIGGTSNTTNDVISLVTKGVDYVGLGPFRFTKTKKNLSPIIGVTGYREIMCDLMNQQLDIPVIAIGGILNSDILNILQTGIYGVALAGSILENGEIEKNISTFNLLTQH
jgi:thiamine-phosphate pyrophosphorylase